MWRKWLYEAITGSSLITDLIPAERWFSSPALDRVPEAPFGVYRLGVETEQVGDVTAIPAEIWVHDKQSSYLLIDDVIMLLRAQIPETTVPDGGYPPVWIGDSADQQDESMGTIFRTSSFQLYGRRD